MSLTSTFEFLVLFALFLPFVAGAYKIHSYYLLLTSLAVITFFYPFLSILLFILTAYIYAVGWMIYKAGKYKKALLAVNILILVVTLSFFKYPQVQNYLSAHLKIKWSYLSFVGISYFTFKFWHYLADIYRGKIRPASVKVFFLYTFFFPTYMAGPIERIEHFSKNADLKAPLSGSNITMGAERIIIGVFKKIVMAAYIGDYVKIFYAHPDKTPWFMLWVAVYLYALQIYFDFSGYSDIAIGISRLFGYDIVENFNKPYLQPNISAFWKNWHISLTGWLGDYIFLPVRRSLTYIFKGHFENVAAFLARVINMVICGIWHGNGWNFIFWGLYHGIGLGVYRIFKDRVAVVTAANEEIRLALSQTATSVEAAVPQKGTFISGLQSMPPILVRCISVIVTFNFVSVGWVFFANNLSTAQIIISRMFGLQYQPMLLLYATLGALFTDWLIFKGKNKKIIIILALLFGIILLRQDTKTPEFIYKNF